MAKTRYGKYYWQNDTLWTSEDIEDAVRFSFGETGTRYAIELAEMDDFNEFADSLHMLGLVRCDDTSGTFQAEERPSAFVRAVMSMRYPFLISHNLQDAKNMKNDGVPAPQIADAMFGYTFYDMIPSGWAARFGLEICEDIRTILESDANTIESSNHSEAIAKYNIEDIKEKYGTLRWYDWIVTEDENVKKAMGNLNHVYEMFSGATCIECGATQDVLMTTGGWISVLCDKHLKQPWSDNDAVSEFAKNHGYEKGWVGYDLSRIISKYLTCQGAGPVTANPEKLVLTWHENGEEKKSLPYKELETSYPNLQVFRLMNAFYGVDEIDIPTIEEIEAKIAEENAKL